MVREIYRDADVVVTADLRPDAPAAVIAFSAFEERRPPRPFGDGFIQSLGYAAVFVTATENHWWQMPARDAPCAAVAAAAAPFPHRIGYGSSMGGHGALLLGRAMGCTRVIAIAPQTALADPVAKLAPSHRACIGRRPIIHDDIAGALGGLVPEIVSDPHHGMDKHHVAHLAARHAVMLRPYPFAGHLVLRTLQEAGILRETVEAWFSGQPDCAELQGRYERAQHRSATVIRNIAHFEIRQGRHDAARRSADILRATRPDWADQIVRMVDARIGAD